MGMITISRQYGSDGRTVGLEVAKALGYRYMNKELLVEVAYEARIPLSEAERYDEQPEHAVLRALKKLLVSPYPENMAGHWVEPHEQLILGRMVDTTDSDVLVVDEDTFVRLTQEVMLRLANQGNVVLIGRGGQALLADRMGVLHVRIEAPMQHRLQTVMKRDEVSREGAESGIRDTDKKRKCYIKRHFGIAWDASHHYDLAINTQLTGIEGASRIIVEAARYKCGR